MTVLRCTAKLLKRLRQPVKPPEPAPHDNPLGEWYGDVFFHRREPFALLLNAATCAALVLPARAGDLRMLGEHAEHQLAVLLDTLGIRTADALRETMAWRAPITFAATADRSMTSLMNLRKYEAWDDFDCRENSPIAAAARLWNVPFTRKNVRGHAFAADLVKARLLPSAQVVDLAAHRGTLQ